MFFSDLPIAWKVFALAAWLILFLAGMAAVAWGLSTGLFALPDYVILPLGGAVFGLTVGLIIGERSALRRYAPGTWADGAPARLQRRRDALAKLAILGIGVLVALVCVLLSKL